MHLMFLKILSVLLMGSMAFAEVELKVGSFAMYFPEGQQMQLPGQRVQLVKVFEDQTSCLVVAQDQKKREIRDHCQRFAAEIMVENGKTVMCMENHWSRIFLGEVQKSYRLIQDNDRHVFYEVATSKQLRLWMIDKSPWAHSGFASWTASSSVLLINQEACAEARGNLQNTWVYNQQILRFGGPYDQVNLTKVQTFPWAGVVVGIFDLTGKHWHSFSLSGKSIILAFPKVWGGKTIEDQSIVFFPGGTESIDLIYSPLYGETVIDKQDPHLYGVAENISLMDLLWRKWPMAATDLCLKTD